MKFGHARAFLIALALAGLSGGAQAQGKAEKGSAEHIRAVIGKVDGNAVRGNVKNLGYSAAEIIASLDKFVFKGPATANGMPDFTGKLTADQVEKIKAFIQGTADRIRPK